MRQEAFDPRKQQLANKRKGDQDDEPENKKRRTEKPGGTSTAFTAALKAGQLQRLREAEQSKKRRSLNLPAPQVGESELEEIVKMGMVGEQAHRLATSSENEATRGLVGSYTGVVGSTPIRTPRAPPQEDHIANEIRNIRALTETQSSLLGGENTPLHEGSGSTGFDGAAPRRNVMSTPNPMATPMRQAGALVPATPLRNGVAATPLRTPRDNFAINRDGTMVQARSSLKSKFASLPKPKEVDWELELPEERQADISMELSEEDAAERDRRNAAIQKKAEEAEFKRRTQVLQKGLPRPVSVDPNALAKIASQVKDPVERAISTEMAQLIIHDATRFPLPGSKLRSTSKPLPKLSDDLLQRARLAVLAELPKELTHVRQAEFEKMWGEVHNKSVLPGLAGYGDEIDEHQLMVSTFDVSITPYSLSSSSID
jgi:pre-mRNA-splicing factor CDC5/CEF1